MSEQDNGNGNGHSNGRDKSFPSHRVTFARINGQDRKGNDILGPAREIGSIWPRKDKEGDGILRFDHIPEEMRQGGGVVFIRDLRQQDNAGKAGPHDKTRNRDSERDR